MSKSEINELSKLYSKKVLTTKERKRINYLKELQQNEKEERLYNRISFNY